MCDHHLTIGDNYGVTCATCGEVLEGFGVWTSSLTCLHDRVKYGEGDEAICICIYCEETRPADYFDKQDSVS